MDPQRNEPPPDPRRTTLIALVFVLALVIGGLFLTYEPVSYTHLQAPASVVN